jgi:hypothetical protein
MVSILSEDHSISIFNIDFVVINEGDGRGMGREREK